MAFREIHVAVAVIVREHRVLIARRPDHVHQGGLLEFPGGKVEAGETVRQALVREIREETGLRVPLDSLRPVIEIRHDYGDKQVFLDVWRTDDAAGEAEGREGQPVQWLPIDELRDDEFPAANRPIIRALTLPSWLAITGAFHAPADLVNQFQERVSIARPALAVLRAPALNEWEYQAVARDLVMIGRDHGTALVLHGGPERLDLVPEAAGLHLPWREAVACRARPVPTGKWLGVSCHNDGEVAHALALQADYITLGPVAPTASHPGAPVMGWDAFRRQVRAACMPVYALGGLTPADREMAIDSGAQGIAGISLWWPGV
ncbi:MAG: Nudix family hydrolase [Pseudomonadota bacterium]